MTRVKIQVSRIADENFPIWVEAFLTDINGKVWRFVDKVPILFEGDLPALPTETTMRCSVKDVTTNAKGIEIYTISTETPDHIEDIESKISEFQVTKGQLEM